MEIMRFETEEELFNVGSENEVIDASPCSVYFGASPRWTTGPTRSSRKGGWTEEEDCLLEESVRKFNGRHWKKIAECLPGRTVSQCFCRWDRVLNPAIFKGTWTKEEDDCIMELVRKRGCRKWSVIAKSLPGRVGKQCRERWFNHLDPTINRAPWTEEEEMTLTYYHEIYGNKWAKIARFLPGRSDNAIKNYWNCVLKKNLDSYSLHGCTMDLLSSLNSYNCATELNCLKLKERQSVDKAAFVNENIELRCGAETSASGSGKANGVGKKNEVHKLHIQAEETSQNCLHRESQQLSTLVSNLDADEVPSMDACAMHPISPICCFTPTKYTRSISVNNTSPESILRNSARTFKNTPSIIRKRALRGAAAIAKTSDVTCTPSLKFSCANGRQIVGSTNSPVVKQGFLPYFESETSLVIKSLKRHLDYAFDMEKEADPGKCGKSVPLSEPLHLNFAVAIP